jgi:hypothetical protein
VKRGFRSLRDYSQHWAIEDGGSSGAAWTGNQWDGYVRGPDRFIWTLEEAIITAKLLARQENARIIDIMEHRFPGEFRDGPHDMNRNTGNDREHPAQ